MWLGRLDHLTLQASSNVLSSIDGLTELLVPERTPTLTTMRERLGRRSLVADSIYCAAVGTALIRLRPVAAARTGLPPRTIGGAGAFVIVWAGFVGALSRAEVGRSLAVVGTANVIAASALLAAAARQPRPSDRRIVALTGLEVAAFAASQALALGLSDRRVA